MDLELNHIGQTLAVGGVAVYSGLLLIRTCRASWVPRFFLATESKLQLQHAAVYLAIVFAAGILIEDVSKDYAARRASFLASVLDRALDTDNGLRFRSLFDVHVATSREIRAKPRNIFRELEKTPEPHRAVALHYKKLNELAPVDTGDEIHINSEPNVQAFRSAVDGFYYHAKNRVYREQTYSEELTRLESRVNFTRSLTFLCMFLFPIYSLFALLATIRRVAKFLDIDNRERLALATLAFLFSFGIYAAGTAYRSECNNYNLRVFGYYVSLTTMPSP